MIRILLPLALIAVPLIEIALFVVIGGRIGLLATIAVVIVTAMCGTALLRIQGLEVVARARRAAEAGQMPIQSVVDGVFLFAAGLLLLTPGFLTDAIGFLLFIPPLRRALAAWLWRRIIDSGSFVVFTASSDRTGPPGGQRRPQRRPPTIEGEVIEGDYVEVDETDARDER
jgi:UPF0716 protein FxsA